MLATPLLRHYSIRFIEEALRPKTAADIRPGDAKPPVGAGQQATSMGQVTNQLQQRNQGRQPPITAQNTPKVLMPQ
jgi:hypothetical protein